MYLKEIEHRSLVSGAPLHYADDGRKQRDRRRAERLEDLKPVWKLASHRGPESVLQLRVYYRSDVDFCGFPSACGAIFCWYYLFARHSAERGGPARGGNLLTRP